MKVRPRSLPPGWYPGSPSETESAIQDLFRNGLKNGGKACAGIAPHAGWGFSGSIACKVIHAIRKDIETIVIVGGHLPSGNKILSAFEEGYSTPLGIIEADMELLGQIRDEMAVDEDIYSDNTVEIQLPIIRHFFPEAKVLGMRASPSDIAIRLGAVIAGVSARLGRNTAVIGSTDLTHYGRNYGFSPRGEGPDAVRWVKEDNDRKIVDAFLAMDAEYAISLAGRNHSACSAGGAAAAVSFARESGASRGSLMEYMTSWDIHPSDSFVGYAGITFE